MTIRDLMLKAEEREKFVKADNGLCIRCKAQKREEDNVESGMDLRTLRMACFYAMDELKVPFTKGDREFTLRVCKPCRADWLRAIEDWFFTETKKHYSTDYNNKGSE